MDKIFIIMCLILAGCDRPLVTIVEYTDTYGTEKYYGVECYEKDFASFSEAQRAVAYKGGVGVNDIEVTAMRWAHRCPSDMMPIEYKGSRET